MSNDTTLDPLTATQEAIDALPVLVRTLLNMRGQIATLTTIRDAKVRKGCTPIFKHAKFQCRIGINYDNIAAVKVKREVGILPEVNAGLPWGRWVEGLFPYVIEHKSTYYFRCTTLNNNVIPQVAWIRNGREITKEQAQADCLASEFRENEDRADVFTIKVESLIEINGVAV